ncbi:MAG: hypothetical protein ACTSX1_11680 [Candidatus Heimdallarchaeaceae archaeon]
MISERDLQPGEVICNKCDGVGEILPKHKHFGVEICPKCDGFGKLDWIENIMGKLSTFPLFADPDDVVELYFKGNKLIETTKDGINFC